MSFNLKTLGVALLFLSAPALRASPIERSEQDFLTISQMELKEVFSDPLGVEVYKDIQRKSLNAVEPTEPTDKIGNVIQVAKDLVALGEDVYNLVIKGKPANVTTYAPISVIPRVNGEAVDLLETENWEAPVKRSFEVNYQNPYGATVVSFRYSIIYSYLGSFNGKGAYLTSVQIIPEYVRTLFGFNFTATMKLGGIQNQGTRDNPIAGATILLEYTVSSLMVADNTVSSFFISGTGGFKRL
jgi:hypothetical protein